MPTTDDYRQLELDEEDIAYLPDRPAETRRGWSDRARLHAPASALSSSEVE